MGIVVGSDDEVSFAVAASVVRAGVQPGLEVGELGARARGGIVRVQPAFQRENQPTTLSYTKGLGFRVMNL